eukprot:TRINITY_DN7066_c0_g1_i1.p1 TRINITY_DN7066_c0_g1~~TRINITY_DN7066_c0_g1_i1.p1  ORF type:complete len:440 (-),score=186.01 TRINITY_DN7066_c0_g1_i1:50-1369(-)
MSGVEDNEPPRRPSRPQPPPNQDAPRPPSVNAKNIAPTPSGSESKPAPTKLVVPAVFKNNPPIMGLGDRSNRASAINTPPIKSSTDGQTSPRSKEMALPPTPAKKSSAPPANKPKMLAQASTSNSDLSGYTATTQTNTRVASENSVLRQQLEEKMKRELDLMVDIETANRLSDQYLKDVERLNARIKELEAGSGSSNGPSSGGPTPPAKPRPAPPTKDTTKEERSTNALLLEKKSMIAVLEQENAMLRDDCDKAERKNKEDAQVIKDLNNLANSLRREVESLRAQVKVDSTASSSSSLSSFSDQKRMEDALLKGNLYETVYDFEPEGTEDVELKEGNLVEVLAQTEDGWWKGYNFNTGITGVFPSNYVRLKEGEVVPESEDGRVVRALFDYVATATDEMSFKANDRLRILQENPNGWWFGRNLENDSAGLFPSNYAGDE